MDPQIQKQLLRHELIEQRQKLTSLFTEFSHISICKHLAHWINDHKITQVLMFYPFRNEPDLRHLHRECDRNKVFALPVILSAQTMCFYKWQLDDLLKKSKLGIPEPDPMSRQPIIINDSTLILVPALAIDKTGIRLGDGGGFYDRFLKTVDTTHIICVVWDEFLLDIKLPKSPWDIPIKLVATESGVFRLD